MKALHRLATIGVIFMLLFAGLAGSASAQSEGDQTGTNQQSGGGQAAPDRPDNPDPAPKPNPPSNGGNDGGGNDGGGNGGGDNGGGSQGGNQGGTNTTNSNTQSGQQGPEREPEQPSNPPSSDGSGEFYILVDKSDHKLYAFRGDSQVFSAINNVGQPGWDTPEGTFYINSKYTSDDMLLYSNLPDVPWVMYFTNEGHAIHGTYWTAVNGRDVSHGCVNLSIPDAQALFNITPIGTRVVVQA